jgi:hypothetical protein
MRLWLACAGNVQAAAAAVFVKHANQMTNQMDFGLLKV